MSEEALLDDQSHYEVSLTAGQAFLAFVLLLLSLAASFAFGLLIGRGQMDDKFTTKRDAAVVNESASTPKKTVVAPTEVATRDDDFKAAPAATITEEQQPEQTKPVAAAPVKPVAPKPAPAAAPVADDGPRYAQILSTSDQRTAEALAARVIDNGFTSAYVERGTTAKGPVFRVRIKFANEASARAAEAMLKTFSTDVWITR